MPRAVLLAVVLLAETARADEARAVVRGRAAWLSAGGAALAVGGAVVLGLGLNDRHNPDAATRSTHEVVGGVALLVFAAHVGVLAALAALWPLDAIVLPLEGGAGLWLQGAWP